MFFKKSLPRSWTSTTLGFPQWNGTLQVIQFMTHLHPQKLEVTKNPFKGSQIFTIPKRSRIVWITRLKSFSFKTRWNVQLHAVRELFDENGAGEPTTAEGFKVEVWIHKKPFPPTAWRLVKWYVCLGDVGFQRQVWIGGGLKIDVVKKDRWWIGPSGGLLKRFVWIFFAPEKIVGNDSQVDIELIILFQMGGVKPASYPPWN